MRHFTPASEAAEDLFDPGYPALAILAGIVSIAAIALALRGTGRAASGGTLTCLAVCSGTRGGSHWPSRDFKRLSALSDLIPVTVILFAAVATSISALPRSLGIALGVPPRPAECFVDQPDAGRGPQRPNWRAAADIELQQTGTRIVIGGEASGDPLRYYLTPGTQGPAMGDAVYRARRLVLISQCDRDPQAMLDSSGGRCEWDRGRPAWISDAFRPLDERELGNVMVRTFEVSTPDDRQRHASDRGAAGLHGLRPSPASHTREGSGGGGRTTGGTAWTGEQAVSPGLISVIIPVFNGGEDLRCCLEAIRNQQVGDREVEIVVDRCEPIRTAAPSSRERWGQGSR